MRIAINGFGRIGRNFLRAIHDDKQGLKDIEVVLINVGPADIQKAAHMFKYDTLMGTYAGSVRESGDELIVDDTKIKLVAQTDPLKIDWGAYGIDWVVDASGHFTNREGAEKFLKAGAQHVLITAPAKGEDVSIIPGVNDMAFTGQKIVSLGSCTTNALMPMLKVMNDSFSIVKGAMTTIHAYTNSQVLLDVEASDLRRARAAALNIIPTTTGATKMISKIFPELDDKISGISVRVPVAKVSLIDLALICTKDMTSDSINKAFKDASAQGSLAGKLQLSKEPLVSSDYAGSNFSVIIDGLLTNAAGTFAKLFGWYDNEWAYSVRLKDFLMNVS